MCNVNTKTFNLNGLSIIKGQIIQLVCVFAKSTKVKLDKEEGHSHVPSTSICNIIIVLLIL